DSKAKEITTTTVSQTEIARLLRCINVQLEIVQDNERRGIKIVWARKGRSGMIIWDESGCWSQMPEKIEAALYDGLSAGERKKIESETPIIFKSPQHALSWSVDQGAFQSIEEARKTYDVVKTECQPTSAKEMAALWQAEIRNRKLSLSTPKELRV
ncbi:MAG: hypothetical protein VX278_15870, partial [Myxococcota bacterium]|nr:hypothetical protein [Myxococcota bacterium]